MSLTSESSYHEVVSIEDEEEDQQDGIVISLHQHRSLFVSCVNTFAYDLSDFLANILSSPNR